MSYDIFISYSRLDIEAANELCAELDRLGVSYWIDRNIYGSANFVSEIPRYIKECKAMIFIASSNSAKSDFTQKEILFALKHHKRIIPYRIGAFRFENNVELDFIFTNVQWVEGIPAMVSTLDKLGFVPEAKPEEVEPQVELPREPQPEIKCPEPIQPIFITVPKTRPDRVCSVLIPSSGGETPRMPDMDEDVLDDRQDDGDDKPSRSGRWRKMLWIILALLAIVGVVWGGVVVADKKEEQESIKWERIATERERIAKMIEDGKGADGVYKVGYYYNRGGKQGVVFEVNATGKHGKIVSLYESSSELQWSSDSAEQKRIIGVDDMIDGANNMAKVKQIPDWQSKYPAFKWCADFGDGWYLPAIAELILFTLDKSVHDAVNKTLAIKGVRLAEVKSYWTSTEVCDQTMSGDIGAWLVHMYLGGTSRNYKYYNYYVRAVSAF